MVIYTPEMGELWATPPAAPLEAETEEWVEERGLLRAELLHVGGGGCWGEETRNTGDKTALLWGELWGPGRACRSRYLGRGAGETCSEVGCVSPDLPLQ